jgi:translation initiation factor IF-2
LAKELGVKSKAVVEKCQAEGLDVKNHMSTISAGLAATIREWFSEGEHTTTVEKSQRVDLNRVRVKKPKKKKSAMKPSAEGKESDEKEVADEEQKAVAQAEGTPESASGGAVETVEEGAEAAAEDQKGAETEVRAGEAVAESGKAAGPEAEDKGESADKGKAKKAKKKDEGKGKGKKEEKETKPEPIVPAGPQLDKPKPAKLSGPKVVRVEKVEPHQPKRRRSPRPSKPKYDEPISQPLMSGTQFEQPVKPAGGKSKRGKGKKKGKDREGWDDLTGRGRKKRMHAKDLEERQARLAAARGESLRSKPSRKIEDKKGSEGLAQAERPDKAHISEPITVKDLSSAIAVRSGDIIAKLMNQGIMATANQVITTDVAELISLEFGTELIVDRKESVLEQIEKQFEAREKTDLVKRPPVVTMLGHVDHGKTSLLDRIRETAVAEGEAGGITQHIGAYQISVGGKKVTFLDTPGHEAFTAMRARGANMTDIVVLVIAADDGVMPQTIEAIKHAKAAGVEILVALNKIDIPGVDVNRVYGQLAEYELTPAEWGGDTEIVKTSATTGEGIEDLIEHLDYIADLKEYKASKSSPAMGWVVEAEMTTTQGAVATLLVKDGELLKGDVILAGKGYGRIRSMKDSTGKSMKKAHSSDPVVVSGLSNVPQAGDKFFQLDDINHAKSAAEEYQSMIREDKLAKRNQVTLDNLFSHIESGNVKELNVIIRADVQGSVDVLRKYLTDLSTEEVKVKVIHDAVGGITEGDVVLAEASGAIIIGFNIRPDDKVRQLAEDKGIDIRLYSVIYKITEELKQAMEGLLEPEEQEKELGSLVVRDTFKVSGVGTIAGCYVKDGIITNKSKLRLIRDNIVIKDNCKIDSLKHFKDDVREVKAGLECGIKIAGFDDIKIDDIIEAYEIIEVARTL